MRMARLTLTLTLTLAVAAIVPVRTLPPSAGTVGPADGQRAGGPPPQNPPPAAAQRGARGGGGGRGRGAVQIMTLTTPWPAGAEIPLKYTQAGDEVSPAISWDNAPDTTESFVLFVHDVTAPVGQGTDDLLHWMVWNIPAAARALPEGVPQGPQLPDGSRQISVSGPYYRGPAAPASGPAHLYMFELYALDATINVPAVSAQGVPVTQTRADVVEAMEGHIRGKAVAVGTFKRK